MVEIKIVTKTGQVPSYETEGASGMDIRAFIESPICLNPGERKLINTGLYVEIPKGYEAQVRARSGLSIKHGITLINGIGTVDSDYRGELMVPLVNLGQEAFTINNGDRIAQMVIAKYETCQFKIVEKLSDTKRGKGGFGHTGV